jgi:hypothetical protein
MESSEEGTITRESKKDVKNKEVEQQEDVISKKCDCFSFHFLK